MQRMCLAAAIVLTLCAAAGSADAVTVKGLQKECFGAILAAKKAREAGQKMDALGLFAQMQCHIYLRGVHDTKVAHDLRYKKTSPYCFPGKPRPSRLAADFVLWSSKNKDKMDMDAAAGVILAFGAKYPCRPGFRPDSGSIPPLKVHELTKYCLDWLTLRRKDKQTGKDSPLTWYKERQCKYYVQGVHGSKLAHDIVDKNKGPYCVPPKMGYDQSLRIYPEWAAKNPKYKDATAAVGYMVALQQKFTCG